MADVFISYSRSDSDFVRALDEHLKAEGRDVWVDWEDIPPASDWQQDIYDSIDAAESFVFVVSTRSLGSEYCGKELSRAEQGGKRIVPIACDAADPAAAPSALAQLNWIWCRDGDDRDAAFAKLTTALETDLAWAKAHTRLLVRAVEWENRGADSSLLLRGSDLTDAEQSLAANAAKQPAPTELQHRFVGASRRGAARRLRFLLAGVSLALGVSVVLGVLALLQRNTANDRAQVARSQALAAEATQALASRPPTALADAVRSVETKTTPEAETALRDAILANPIVYSVPRPRTPGDATEAIAFGGGGRRLAVLTSDGLVREWQTATATARAPPPVATHALGIGYAGTSLLAVVAAHGTTAVLDVATGKRTVLRGGHPTGAVVAGAGSRVLTSNADSTRVQVWDGRSGRRLADLPGGAGGDATDDGRLVATVCCPAALWSISPRKRLLGLGDAKRVAFDSRGATLAAVGADGTARLYDTRSRALRAMLPDFGTLNPFGLGSSIQVYSTFDPAVAFDDAGHVAVADSDGFVRVWDVARNKVVGAVDTGFANTLRLGSGGVLGAMTWDGSVVVARLPSTLALTPQPSGEQRPDFAPALSDDRTRLVMPARGGGVVAGIDGSAAQPLPAPSNKPRESILTAWAVSGDASTAAESAGLPGGLADTKYRSWTAVWHVGDRQPFLRLPPATSPILLSRHGAVIAFDGRAWRTGTAARIKAFDGALALAPDGRTALVRRSGSAALVTLGSSGARRLEGFGRLDAYADVTGVFDDDGTRLLTQAANGVRLWDVATGHLVAVLGRGDGDATSVAFGQGGRLALVTFAHVAATFDGTSGKPLSSLRGSFKTIAGDGTLAAGTASDGELEIADLRTGVQTTLQTDTARSLSGVAFAAAPDVLVVTDVVGDVHLVHCAICASDGTLLTSARATLTRLPVIRRPATAMTR